MRVLAVFVVVCALSAAWPTQADEPFDPQEIRVITPTESTSKCIGDPQTPICAVETLLACFARGNAELCEIVKARESDPENWTYSISYRVLISRIIREQDIPPSLADAYWIKPGYAEVVIEDIVLNNEKCTDFCRVSYALRPSPTGWIVLEYVALGVD